MIISKSINTKTVKNIILTVTGTLFLSFGTAVFTLPFNMVVGGMSGLAIIIDAFITFEFLTIDLIITILTWLFFFIGLFVLGKDFAMKTLISTLIYPIGISVFLKLTNPNVLGGVLCLQQSEYPELALIISAVVGGALIGTGCAITFLGGGSTGGIDIIAFVLCKIIKRVKHSLMIFILDTIVILLGIFVINDLLLSLLGIISALISAIMIDKVFLGGSAALVGEIITDKYEEITHDIIEKLERTTTIFKVTGGYTKEGKKLLMVSFTMRQHNELMNIINTHDKNAFITIYKAYKINGEGWTKNTV